jgi:hypothetical protein
MSLPAGVIDELEPISNSSMESSSYSSMTPAGSDIGKYFQIL